MTLPTEYYRRQLSRHLKCDKKAKERLLDSFERNMLSPLLEISNQPSLEELRAAFGTPQEVAALLMEQITEEELLRYRKQKKLCICACLAIAAAILVFAIYTLCIKEFTNITHISYPPC